VEVLELRLVELAPPRASIDVTVSSGTYIRSLAHDLGQRLGCGAHLDGLRRTRVGSFAAEDASSLEALQAIADAGGLAQKILSPSRLLGEMEAVSPGREGVHRLVHGLPLEVSLSPPEGQRFLRVLDEAGELAAVCEWSPESGLLRPVVVLSVPPREELQGS
jgi:tRNA pseudouridine55 synthase